MRFPWLLAALAPFSLSMGPAWAVEQIDIQHCLQMGDADLAIAGCTNIAEDKSVDAHDRAVAYFNLGIGHYAKNDLDHAIDDWTQAVKLQPDYVHAYNNLAKAYRAKADYAKAIANYDEAIKIDPKHSLSYKGRGIAEFFSGGRDKAKADFQQALAIDPTDAYSLLWLEITKRRLGAKPSDDLAKATTKLSMTSWPAPLLLLYEGQMMPHDVVVAAQNVDNNISKARMCDVGFYGGELSLIQGDKAEAAKLFRQGLGVCYNSVDERAAAIAELKAMGETP